MTLHRTLLPGLMVLLLAVPAGAKDEDTWGIRCASYVGPNRVKLADNCAEHLQHVDGLHEKLIRVYHEQDESVVYYGQYKRSFDDRTGQSTYKPNPDRDLALVHSLSMQGRNGEPVWPFRMATLDSYPVPMSIPRAWKLERNPGHYALQVAVFYNTEEMRQRRSAAEQYCKLLRDQGEEAYIHHGPVHSSVCIGAFPKAALRTFQQADAMTGRVQVVQRIVDPKMLAVQKRYPHNLHNGAKMYQVVRQAGGQKGRELHLSFAVEVPKPDPFQIK